MDLAYRGDFVVIAPYQGREGAGYGEGEGAATGERINGTVRWSNHPRRREDGVLMPDAHGIIDTADGARILFHLGGYSVATTGQTRSIVSPASFQTDDDRYRWLNVLVCVGEGEIDFRTLALRLRVYACVNELAEGSPEPPPASA